MIAIIKYKALDATLTLTKSGTWKEINDWANSLECFAKAFGWERTE